MEYEVTKDFEQITLKDDFMFFSVMSDKELLERILDIKIKKLDEAVRIKRRNADWRVKYMKYELNLLESRREGIEEGEKRLSSLISILNKEKRYDDIDRVINDKEYKYELYKEFNIQ